ncbi:HAD-IIIA family hydrolase [Salsuginibacillus kocurii]|uniref:HAD-IIIA family hydrolase n=1 Tax=Salsuginibacillus kocurii TaxID=427078 RepID=UPI000361D848|nr:HAD-IIIA family hydrolase [Salsuginibacillus kocurii]
MNPFSKNIEAVFIDRDGTLGGDDYELLPGDFWFYPGIKNSIKRLKQHNIPLFTFTNQPLIAYEKTTIEAFKKELKGVGFDYIYVCPHDPKSKCECRKPASGMLEAAALRHGLHLKHCVVIGDRWTDMLAAEKTGCHKILVKTGAGKDAFERLYNDKYRGEWANVSLEFAAEDFNKAVTWILERINSNR